MRLRPVIAALALTVLVLPLRGVADAEPEEASEYALKAAFLYNFAKFVSWPEEPVDEPFAICSLGDAIEDALHEAVKGRAVRGRPVVARVIGPGESIDGCHLLFVERSRSGRLGEIVAAAEVAHVLTVGDTEDFTRRGGVIRFLVEGRRIRFEINPSAAEASGLRVSAQLLKLARIHDEVRR